MRNVEWIEDALDQLTRIWSNADSGVRKSITKATHALEKRLAGNPENEGESRSDGRRITFESPLVVVFRIEAGGQTVTLLEVRLIRSRSK